MEFSKKLNVIDLNVFSFALQIQNFILYPFSHKVVLVICFSLSWWRYKLSKIENPAINSLKIKIFHRGSLYRIKLFFINLRSLY